MGHGRDIWKRRYLESYTLAGGFENRRDLVSACAVLGSSVVALPRKAPLHPCLGVAVFCCRLCFRTVRTAAVEHPSGNVRGRVPLLGVSCQEMRCTWRCETFPLRVGYCVYYLGGRHHVFRWHEHGRQ